MLLKTHQLALDAFLVALKFMKVTDVDIDEVQCILANLIYMVSVGIHSMAWIKTTYAVVIAYCTITFYVSESYFYIQ